MKSKYLKAPTATILGCLLTLPAAYFIFISVMKFSLGLPYLFDASIPFLEATGITDSFGFNINLFIIFGPLFALLINLIYVLHLQVDYWRHHISFHLTIRKSFWNLFIAVMSAATTFILFLFLVLDNC